MSDAIFFLSSVLAVAASLLMVTRRNPIYAAAWMMVTLFALAVVFVLLSSSFLGVVQILLYAGAILVLFVFVIMLLNPSAEDLDAERPPIAQRTLAATTALVLFGLAGYGLLKTGDPLMARLAGSPEAAREAAAAPGGPIVHTAQPAPLEKPIEFGSTRYFGRVIYDTHLVAFELISLLILAAIAAVIAVAKKDLDVEREAADKRTERKRLAWASRAHGAASLQADEAARAAKVAAHEPPAKALSEAHH